MKNKGFTLIELLVVVVVIGVLAGISFVMVQGVIDAARMARNKSFARGIQTQLALNEVGVWRFDDYRTPTRVHDASGWGNHGTLHVGPGGINTIPEHAWVTGVFGRALRFDGNDFVSLPGAISTRIGNHITVEAWVYSNPLPQASTFRGIVTEIWPPPGGMIDFSLHLHGGNHLLRAGFYDGVWHLAQETTSFPISQWVHVAATYNRHFIRIYRDGTQVAVSTDLNRPLSTTLDGWRIGRRHHPGDPSDMWNGFIDEVRIYNRALTVFEIQQRYVKGLKSLLARGIITEEDFNARIAEIEKNLVVK